jgi:enoyl-CoA hydratase/carnithine racemase
MNTPTVAPLRLILRNEYGRPNLTPSLITSLLERLQSAPEAVLITIEGGGDSFCEGLDLELLAEGSDDSCRETVSRYGELLAALDQEPRPVIVLVNGPALGGGVGLAAVADLVLATEESRFALPEVLLGLIPAMVFPVLARRVGLQRARLLALSGRTLSAEEALQWGLVDELASDLGASLSRYYRRLARMDRDATRTMKVLANKHFSLSDHYRTDALASFTDLLASHSTRSRLRRVVEGEPAWPEDTTS